jgi:bZIP transcription factor
MNASTRTQDENCEDDQPLTDASKSLSTDEEVTKTAGYKQSHRSPQREHPLGDTSFNFHESDRGDSLVMSTSPQALEEDDNEGSRKLRRVMANRRSAKESRERRKQLLSKLQATVDILSAENRAILQDNRRLRNQLGELRDQLVQVNALASRLVEPPQIQSNMNLLGPQDVSTGSMVVGEQLFQQQQLMQQLQLQHQLQMLLNNQQQISLLDNPPPNLLGNTQESVLVNPQISQSMYGNLQEQYLLGNQNQMPMSNMQLGIPQSTNLDLQQEEFLRAKMRRENDPFSE